MDSQTYIALISGLVGALVGSLISELGTLFRSYRGDKRVLKRVLYNQLDLWFELKRADISSLLPVLIQSLENELVRRGAPPEQAKRLTSGMEPQLLLVFQAVKLSNPSRVIQRYQESVNELAEVDPILAYYLSGKFDENFQQQIDELLSNARELESNKEISERDDAVVAHLISWSKNEIIQKTLDSLQKDILTVSLRIHFWTRFRASRTFKKFEKKIKEEAPKQTAKMVDTLAQLLGNTPSQETPGSTQTQTLKEGE